MLSGLTNKSTISYLYIEYINISICWNLCDEGKAVLFRLKSLKALSNVISWCTGRRFHIFSFMWNYVLNCQNKFDSNDIAFKMTNIKADNGLTSDFSLSFHFDKGWNQYCKWKIVLQYHRPDIISNYTQKKKEVWASSKACSVFLTRHLERRQNSNSIQQSIFPPSSDYEQRCCSRAW